MKKILLALFVVTLIVGRAAAGDFYWDADADATGNMTDGTNLGGLGFWDATSLNWWDGAAANDVAWPDGNTAVFIGTPGQVFIPASNTRTVTGLTFKTDGFQIAGEGTTVATFGATAFGAVNALLVADPGVVGHIGSKMTGTAGYTVDGGGTIRLSATVNSSSTTGAVTVKNGSTLELAYAGAIGGTGAGAGAITLMDNSTLRNTNDSTTAANNGVTFLTGNRNIILQGAAGNTIVPQSTGLYSGIISGTILKMTNNPAAANNELRISGGAAQVNTFQKLSIDAVNESFTTFSAGQASTLGSDANFGAVPASFMQDNITLANGGAIRFLGATSVTDTITLNANRGVTLAGGSGRVRADTANAAIPGKITGPGMLVKSTGVGTGDGSFTLTITANNDYSGGTRIEEGVLLVNNTTGSGTGSGPVTVTTGLGTGFGTLAGTGSIGGAVTLDPGAHLAPGNRPPGTTVGGGSSMFTIPSVSLSTGTFFDATLGDILKITTADTGLDLSGGTISIAAASNPSGQTITLIDYPVFGGAQGYTGSLGSMIINNSLGYEATVSDDPANHRIKVDVSTTAIDRTWIRESDFGFWSLADGSNWSTGSEANGTGSIARFPTVSPVTTNPMPTQTVTIGDISKTVGTLVLDKVNEPDVNGNSYTIASASSGLRLVMNAYGNAAINVVDGNHSITAGLTLTAATDINVSGSNVLSVAAVTNSGGMTKTGTGTLLITAADWAGFGPTTINEGTLKYNNNSTGLSNVSVVTIGPNGTLDQNATGAVPVNDTYGALAGSGQYINVGNLTLQGINTTPVEFSGNITANVGDPAASRVFTKNGVGTQILSGANEFTSAAVNGGTLLVNNTTGSATGAGAVTVASGATLGGTGHVGGLITVNSGGIVSPGTSIGTLHTDGGLTLNSGSKLTFELDTILGNDVSDMIDAALSTLTIAASTTTQVNLINAGAMTAGTYTLIDYGTLTGVVTSLTLGTQPAGFTYSLVNNVGNTSIDLLVASAGLPGDYNNDGKVNAADYVLWRKNPGAFGGDPAGYNTWRANFGNPPGSGSSIDGGASVPEPATLGLLLTIIVSALTTLRRSR